MYRSKRAASGRLRNDGARAVAREYSRILGIPKSEMRKLTGKKFSKVQKSRRRALTEPQQRIFLAALAHEAPDIAASCLLMLTLGLRIAELPTIRVDASGVSVVGKGDKKGHVPFSVDPRSRGVVQAIVQKGIQIANAGRTSRAIKRIVKSNPALKGLTAHVLRHTYATNAMHAGVDPKVLQGALRHSSFKVTLTYLSTIQH